MSARPMPQKTSITAPYWDGCNEGKLRIQRCSAAPCGKYVFYPRVCCPYCHGGELSWVDASGRGKVTAFTYVHRPQHESFFARAPICFIAVELAEGPTIYSELRGHGGAQSLSGQPVSAVFDDVGDGNKLVYFELAA